MTDDQALVTITPRPRPTATRRLFIVIILGVLVVAGLVVPKLNTYQIVPGSATPLAPMISVKGVATAKPTGRGVSMVDVGLVQMSPWDWLHVQIFGGETIAANDLVPSGVPVSQFNNQSYLDMANAKSAASVVAARQLGWTVPATPRGAEVEFIAYPSPAAKTTLGVADWIEAVNGTPVTSACGLVAAVHDLAPRSLVRLTVQHARISDAGAITRATATTTISLRTAPVTVTNEDTTTVSGCPTVTGTPKSSLGVFVNNAVSYRLPMTVSVNTAYIGGPSAGLAMTLALIDEMTGGRLTAGHRVAVTGTMDASGAVGDVGGVAEKTIAAITNHNSLFIVPRSEVTVARDAAGGRLKVVGVDTITQALAALRQLSGSSLIPLTKPTLRSATS